MNTFDYAPIAQSTRELTLMLRGVSGRLESAKTSMEETLPPGVPTRGEASLLSAIEESRAAVCGLHRSFGGIADFLRRHGGGAHECTTLADAIDPMLSAARDAGRETAGLNFIIANLIDSPHWMADQLAADLAKNGRGFAAEP